MSCVWIVTFCILTEASGFITASGFISASGFMDRLGDRRDSIRAPQSAEDPYRANSRLHPLRRWRREVMETCPELTSPWRESTERPEERATVLRLRIRSYARGGEPRSVVFPGRDLFDFVRRAYRCCQEGSLCRHVKGIQGHLREGAHAEFLLGPDVLSLPLKRAELHLHIFNPKHFNIQPLLLNLAKRNLPTRYEVRPRGDSVELTVDLLSPFRGLVETAGGADRGGAPSPIHMLWRGVHSRGGPTEAPGLRSPQDTEAEDGVSRRPPLELGLALSCSLQGRVLPCRHAGLRLSHTPFIALSY